MGGASSHSDPAAFAHSRATDSPDKREIVREFTVAVFVVHESKVLLHWHRKLQRWLPPGGHIEPGELPDEAAVRETWEEVGIGIELVDALHKNPMWAQLPEEDAPRRLAQPLGIQLEDIGPDHQHIDLIYAARPRHGASSTPRPAADDPDSRPAWYGLDVLPHDGLTHEVIRWAKAAVQACAAD